MSDVCLECGRPKPESDDEVCRDCRIANEVHLCEDCGAEFEPFDSGSDDCCGPCAEERDDAARLRAGLYRSIVL